MSARRHEGILYFPKRKLNLGIVRLQPVPVHEKYKANAFEENQKYAVLVTEKCPRTKTEYFGMPFLPHGFFVVIHFMTNFKDIDLLISFWFSFTTSFLT